MTEAESKDARVKSLLDEIKVKETEVESLKKDINANIEAKDKAI